MRLNFSANEQCEEKGGGFSPAACSHYFWITVAMLCEPYCAVNEVLVTLAAL